MYEQIEDAEVEQVTISVRRSFHTLRAWAVSHAAEIVCAVALMLMSLQMLFVISRKSITVDEIVMIPSGYYHVAAQNFELINDHPPVSKIIAAIPLLFLQPEEIRPEQVVGAPGSLEERLAHQDRFWDNNSDKFLALSFWPRVFMMALTIGLGLLIFRFARELFGSIAAVLAVILFSLEPTVLAHGRVVQTDIPASFGYLLFWFMLRKYSLDRSIKRATWLGFAIGLAILTKFSMLLVGPIVVGYFAISVGKRIRQRKSWIDSTVHISVAALVSIITINGAYFFQHRRLAPWDVQWIQEAFPNSARSLTSLASALSYIAPADFVLGILRQISHNSAGHPAGLLGMYSRTGWWYYFPVAFALKTTIPFLLASLLALSWSAFRAMKMRDQKFLWILAPFVIYTVYVLFSHINIGVRYYLPAYSFLFILSGAMLASMLKSKKRARVAAVAAVALMGWMSVEALRAFPNHVSYMNELAIGKPHWWYLSDSNVEWGDDTPALAAYLRARGETRVRTDFLGDFFLLHYYGVEPLLLANTKGREPERTRYAAIGASFLNGSTVPAVIHGRQVGESERVNFFDKYRHKTPEAIFGNSIYLYREDDQ
ncbi:MAG TPA: glycosyltransferase family 39 protein [Pyrinomonadaceae bacterium]|nr:glycosyltransferase family 39 protein [Pyrinomonadaceae bacterium]